MNSQYTLAKQSYCQICYQDYTQTYNHILKSQKIKCKFCKITVHRYCYQPFNPNKIFVCDSCNIIHPQQNKQRRCCICYGDQGIMKKILNKQNKFGHVICLLFSPLFLVQSYNKLTFVQIPATYESIKSKCKLCMRYCERINGCICSMDKCGELIHWRCLLKEEQEQNQDITWMHALKKLSNSCENKINVSLFNRRFGLYWQQYFNTQILSSNQIKITKDTKIEKSSKIVCAKHYKISACSCFCQKQQPSGFIFCDSCQSFNHLKCEQMHIKQNPEQYKCLHCRDWQNILKKRKRPHLQIYPNMNIYDYIYIHTFYEQKNYRMLEKQYQCIWKLPFAPSLKFYQVYIEKYLFKESYTQQSVEMLRKYVRNSKKNKYKHEQLQKAVKLVAIMVADYDNIGSIKDIGMGYKNTCNISNIQKALKCYDKKFNKFEQTKPQISINEIIQSEKTRQNYENIQQESLKQIKIPMPVLPPIPTPTCKQQINNATQKQNQNNIIDLKKQILIDINKSNSLSLNKTDNNTSINNNRQRKMSKRIFVKQISQRLESVFNNSTTAQILLQLKKAPKSIRHLFIEWQRDLELRKQDNKNKQYVCFQQQYLHKTIIRSLQKDLMVQNCQISVSTRKKMLKQLQKNKSQHNKYGKYSQHIIKLQKNIMQLIQDLNKLPENLQHNIKISKITQLKQQKPTNTTINKYIQFFYKCKNIQLNNYSIIINSLDCLAQQIVNHNIDKSIKQIKQLQAYQVIRYNFSISESWIQQQSNKVQILRNMLDKIKIQIQLDTFIDNYITNNNNISNNSNNNNINNSSQKIGRNIQLLIQCISYCQQHNISYYTKQINKYINWYKIYQICLNLTPIKISHHNHHNRNGNRQYKIDGQFIIYVSQCMRQSQFPNNLLRSWVEEYRQKYEGYLQKVSKLSIFMQMFDSNIKQMEIIQGSKHKYAKQQVACWLEQVKNSQFVCQQFVYQVEQIIQIYKMLLDRISRQNNGQNRQHLLNKMQAIPIIHHIQNNDKNNVNIIDVEINHN